MIIVSAEEMSLLTLHKSAERFSISPRFFNHLLQDIFNIPVSSEYLISPDSIMADISESILVAWSINLPICCAICPSTGTCSCRC